MSYKKSKNHKERCKRCKETVGKLLEKIYGKVELNYKKFKISTRPEDFKDIPYYDNLIQIYSTLQSYRNFKQFVKAKTLRACDFFIPDQKFIVEFDESQHFTKPRKLSLENYHEKLKLGFDKHRWIELCKEINAKDNHPHYRDEQRAWYDTLRDILPAIMDLKPTVRLFAKDHVWCNFDPSNKSDIEKFKNIIEGISS